MSEIQYFEPCPPEVWAMPLWSDASLEERMKHLSKFPGVARVIVEWLHDDHYLLVIEPVEGAGDRLTIDSSWVDEQWLVAVITNSADRAHPRTIEVKMMHTKILNRVYRPTAANVSA